MTALGVFRDEFYNAAAVLTEGQFTLNPGTGAQAMTAAQMAGARRVVINFGADATSFTTDTAANIIARLQNAVAVQYKALGIVPGAGSGGASTGVPNLNNLTYFLEIGSSNNANGVITFGTGVTGVNTTSSSTDTVIAGAFNIYLVTVTGPASISLTNLYNVTTDAFV